jgi:CRP-like cAMP-binding protein
MPVQSLDGLGKNRILAALPVEELSGLAHELERVCFVSGQIVQDPGSRQSHVYFPVSGVFSLLISTTEGASVQLAMTGVEGLVGIPLMLGVESTQYRVVAQGACEAYRLRAEGVAWMMDQDSVLRRLVLSYIHALMVQLAQGVVCNRHHAVEQQLCRWLLFSLDLRGGDQLEVTQELIAGMLGVRREAVTEAAGKLQAAGLIHYRRGHITVLDRGGLEARVCECYGVVRAEYARLFRLMAHCPVPARRDDLSQATLRQRAEARLSQVTLPIQSSEWDTTRLLHELQVHQIELEMHNEALRQAYDEVNTLREKFADIYDFAPVGYFTLDNQGGIAQVNLAGAILLGVRRSRMEGTPFSTAVAPVDVPVFNAFLADVLAGRGPGKCEIVLIPTSHRPAARVRIEAVADEGGQECRMVVIDMTEKPQMHPAFPLHLVPVVLPDAAGSA